MLRGKILSLTAAMRGGNSDRSEALAAELVRLKVDIIVTAGGEHSFCQGGVPTIPIVMAQDADPVANGFVASLARPGGQDYGAV